MKNFNILGFHWKIELLGRGFTKNEYRGGIALKGGLRQFYDIRRGLAKKSVWCFKGGWYRNVHYQLFQNHLTHVLIQPSVIASNDALVGNKWNFFKTMC